MSRKIALVAAFVVAASILPTPALSWTPPETLGERTDLGSLEGPGSVVDPSFPIDFLGISWQRGEEPDVRFLVNGAWT
ncbi:MAG: hypothetical protein ACRDJP_01590, partial [Actinomycetota bacterium]